MENFSMKAKFKILAVAVAMATGGVLAASTAQAAIVTDSYNLSGIGAGTGDAELIFSIYDAARAQSLALDMNLTVNQFRNNNASLINTFSVQDSLLQSFIAGSANPSQMVWNLGGLSNLGLGSNAGILTTNGNAGATINPAVNGPLDGNALTSAMGSIESYSQANNSAFTLAHPNSAVSSASGPAGFLGGFWGTNFGGQTLFNNTVTGFGSDQLMSFIALGATDVSDLSGTPISNTFAGKWHINDATGTVSYVGVSAVPVPAAIWLFGSGLLGLVGISRRKKV
jgi:hypothetical protein